MSSPDVLDALGQPIDPEERYRPLAGFSAPGVVVPADRVYAGADRPVKLYPTRFVPAWTEGSEISRLLFERRTAAQAKREVSLARHDQRTRERQEQRQREQDEHDAPRRALSRYMQHGGPRPSS